jgi:hypothetical protein
VPVVTGRDVAFAGEIYTVQYHNVNKRDDAYGVMDIADPAALYDKLAQFGVNYVFVGHREAAYPFAQALQDTQYFLPAYDVDGVRIYAVAGSSPAPEVHNMDISLIDWLAFFAAMLYLLILPGYNVVRTLGWDTKLEAVEKLVVIFGISVAILVAVSTLLALPFSIGLNFYTLIIPETLIIILTTREVVGYVRSALKPKG